jgi:hypothetical protein
MKKKLKLKIIAAKLATKTTTNPDSILKTAKYIYNFLINNK